MTAIRKKGRNQRDLKLIDELLVDIKQSQGLDWSEVERWSSVTGDAMRRLRRAWVSGEMGLITLSLANYFREVKRAD